MARWSSKLNLLLTATDAVSRPVRGATNSITGFGRATDRSAASLRQFGLQAGRVVSDMQGFTRALDITSAGSLFVANRLDRATTMLRAQTGGTRREIDALQDTMFSLTATTGSSIATVTQLTSALGESGQVIDENAESLVRLVDTWGISAQSAAELNKTTKVLGLTLNNLLDTTANYQKQFGVTGIVSQLPAAMAYALKSVTQFSRSIVRDEKTVIDSTIKTGAVLSKTFGKPFAEGLQMAEAHYTHFSEALENTHNVFLGLEDGFSAMHSALFEAGLSVDQVQKLLVKGRDNPIAFAENIKAIYTRLQETASPWFAERFLQNVKKTSDETVRLYLSDNRKLEAAKKAREQSVDFSGGGWQQMTEAMRDNAETAVTTFDNLLGLAKEIVGSGISEVIREVFGGKEGVSNAFKELNHWIIETKKSFKDADLYQKGLKPILVALGKGIVYFTTFSGLLSPLGAGLGLVADAVKLVLSPLDALSKGADFVLDGIGTLVDVLGNASLAVAGLSLAIPGLNIVLTPLFGILGLGLKGVSLGFTGLGAVGTKNLAMVTAGLATMGAVVRGKWTPTLDGSIAKVEDRFADFGEFIDKNLGGIPGKILNYFFPPPRDWKKAEYTLKDRFRAIGHSVQGYMIEWRDVGFKPALTDLFKNVGQALDDALKGAPTQLANAIFPENKKAFAERTASFGGWLADQLKFWTDPKQVSAWWNDQWKAFKNYLDSDEVKIILSELGKNIGAGLGFGAKLLTNLFTSDEAEAAVGSLAGKLGDKLAKSAESTDEKSLGGILRKLGKTLINGLLEGFSTELGDARDRFVLTFVSPVAGAIYDLKRAALELQYPLHGATAAAEKEYREELSKLNTFRKTYIPDESEVRGRAEKRAAAKLEQAANAKTVGQLGDIGSPAANIYSHALKSGAAPSRQRALIAFQARQFAERQKLSGDARFTADSGINNQLAQLDREFDRLINYRNDYGPALDYLAKWAPGQFRSVVQLHKQEEDRLGNSLATLRKLATTDPNGFETLLAQELTAPGRANWLAAQQFLTTIKEVSSNATFGNKGSQLFTPMEGEVFPQVFQPKAEIEESTGRTRMRLFAPTEKYTGTDIPGVKPIPPAISPAGGQDATQKQTSAAPSGGKTPVNVNVFAYGKDGLPIGAWMDIQATAEGQDVLGR